MNNKLVCPVKRNTEYDPTSIDIKISKPDNKTVKIEGKIVFKDKITPRIKQYYEQVKKYFEE